jgi:site-specific DNA-methyltransferase (adenine-specific)
VRPYYEDDAVTIYHGDALEVIPTLPLVDLVVTDPPYVIGAVSAGNMASKAGGWGDMMNSARWFRDWYAMAHERLSPAGAMWTFCNWRSLPVVMRAASDTGWPIASCLVWHKDWIGPGGTVGLRPAYELVALLPCESYGVVDRGLPDVWTQKWASHKPSGHPAEKPVPLLSRLIRAGSTTKDDFLVLDPFLGSGSTLRAAKDLGLHAIGIEAEERYCEMAARRCAQDVLDLGGALVDRGNDGHRRSSSGDRRETFHGVGRWCGSSPLLSGPPSLPKPTHPVAEISPQIGSLWGQSER